MEEVKRIYAHAAGTSCAIVASALESSKPKSNGGCGARHGCWACQKAEDKSLEAMLAFDDRYAYARGLNKLNKYIRATRFDWSLRHYVGRTIKGGYIEIKPDTYHPTFLRSLTRMMLQLDYDEQRRAQREGGRIRFRILPLEMMIAVDAIQSLQGVAKPFQIWADLRDITERHIRYDVPEIDTVVQTPMPPTRYLKVGSEWAEEGHAWHNAGLRDSYVEALTADSPCAPVLTTLKNGNTAWDVETYPTFDVDSESAAMIEDFEVERLLEQFDAGYSPSGITAGYKWYLQCGALKLQHSNHGKHDEILRRTAFKDRVGLTLDYDVDALYKMAVTFDEMTDCAKAAWKPDWQSSHKAVDDSPDDAPVVTHADVDKQFQSMLTELVHVSEKAKGRGKKLDSPIWTPPSDQADLFDFTEVVA